MRQIKTKSGRKPTITYTMVALKDVKTASFDINEATFNQSFKQYTKPPHGTAPAETAKFEVKKKNTK